MDGEGTAGARLLARLGRQMRAALSTPGSAAAERNRDRCDGMTDTGRCYRTPDHPPPCRNH